MYNLPSLSLEKIDPNDINSQHQKMFFLTKKGSGLNSSSNLFSNISSAEGQTNNGSNLLPNNIMINTGLSSVSVGYGNADNIIKEIDNYVIIIIYY